MSTPIVLEPHRVGIDGPWWTDCFLLLYDGTKGYIIHSTAFYPTRGLALAAARRWLGRWVEERRQREQKTTVVLTA